MLVPFHEAIRPYSVILFDAYGVLKNASGIIAGVHEVLADLTRQGKELYVITNDASRSPQQMAQAYEHPVFGKLIPASRNISSGLLATDFLRAKVRAGKAAYLGTSASAHYVELAGLSAVPLRACHLDNDLRALVLLDDEGFDWFEDLNRALNLLRRLNIPVVVANSDASYPVDGHEIRVAVGSLARMAESILGKSFIHFGKPDALMFSYAFNAAAKARPDLTKSDVVVVGDTLTTDIVGANAFGLDTVLVLTGNTLPQQVNSQIESTGIIPTYVCESILT